MVYGSWYCGYGTDDESYEDPYGLQVILTQLKWKLAQIMLYFCHLTNGNGEQVVILSYS